MNRFVPTWYCKDIASVNLDTLKNEGITVMLLDLDNTIIGAYQSDVSDLVKAFINKAASMFKLYIISNNHPQRVEKIAASIGAGFLAETRKPFISRLERFLEVNNAPKNATVLVGDQLLTDIWCANRLGIKSILVEPFDIKDLLITRLNRYFDRRLRTRLGKKGLLKEF